MTNINTSAGYQTGAKLAVRPKYTVPVALVNIPILINILLSIVVIVSWGISPFIHPEMPVP